MRAHNRFAVAGLLLIGGLIAIDPGRLSASDPAQPVVEQETIEESAEEADGFFGPALARVDRVLDASRLAEAPDEDIGYRLHVWLAHHPIR